MFFLAIHVLPDFPQNASPDVLPHGKTWARWGFWSSHLQWSGMRLACPKLPECWREKCLPLDSGNVVPSKANISVPSPWPFWSDDPLNGIFKQWPNKTWTHCPHHTVFSLRRGCGSVKRCLTPIPCDLPGFTKQRISQMLCTICWHKNSLYVCTMNFSPLKPLFFQKSNHDWTTPAGAFCWLTWAAPNKNAGAQTPPEGATNHHTAQNGYKKEHLFESVDVATWPKLFTNGINIWHLEKEWNQVQCLLPFTFLPRIRMPCFHHRHRHQMFESPLNGSTSPHLVEAIGMSQPGDASVDLGPWPGSRPGHVQSNPSHLKLGY